MRAWKSGIWTLSGQAVHLSVTLGTLAVLGRLLTPEEFGLFGLVLAVRALFLPLLDMGLQPAYIKVKKAGGDASNAFFTVNLIVGGLATLLLLILAPWLASFYGQTELNTLLMVFAFTLFLTAISGQPSAVLSRSKCFDKIVKANTAVLITGSGLVIFLAWSGFGVWSLLWRALYESLARFIILALLSGKRYQLVTIGRIKPYTKDLKFGLEIVFSRLLNGWVKSIDKLVLGKFISLGALGGYTRSQQIALMPDANIRTSITTPALAYIARAGKQDKLGNYLLLNWLVFLLAGTPCLLLIVYGDIMLPLFLGQQWLDVAWMLPWLGLYGLGQIFQGMTIIYHIDQRKVKRSIQYTLGTVPFVLILPITLIILTGSLHHFVTAISIMSVIYWFGALLHTMFRDWSHERLTIVGMKIKMFSIAVSSILFGIWLKAIWLPAEHTMALLFAMTVQLGVGFLLFITLDRNTSKRIYKMVRG